LEEKEIYKELGALTKDKTIWKENLPYVSSLLCHESSKIKAKALWLIGEMGLVYPEDVKNSVPVIASYFESDVPLLRERAVNAIGRIGRGEFKVIEEYWEEMFRFAEDKEPNIRLSFIWASENIATNNPEIYGNYMSVFEKLLSDGEDRVRMEAPEIFRVLGKRRPEFVKPYEQELRMISETDENRVVRIHCLGAVKTLETKV
jgi:HEAT repeat protein